VISGIVQVLKSGGRWIDAPPEYGPRKALCNRFVRWAGKDVWTALFQALAQAGGPPAQVPIDSSAVKVHRSAARGGRTTKIHALTDAQCRPVAFMPTGGHVADCSAGAAWLARLPARDILHADKGYDVNAIRRQVEDRGATPNIPPKANRNGKTASRQSFTETATPSNGMFCRLKDFRRVATRYDRNAANFLGAVSIAATISYWL
jgi:transposase